MIVLSSTFWVTWITFPLQAFQGLPKVRGLGARSFKGGYMIDLNAFEAFVEERHPGTGTASSYRRALIKLNTALRNADPRPVWAPGDLLQMQSPADILVWKRHVEDEQNRFMVHAPSIFEPYRGRGDGYFRKRWCSAALSELAAFVERNYLRFI